jgi:hypothetical protein
MSFFSDLIPIHSTFNKPLTTNSIPPENLITTFFLVDPAVRSLFFLFTLYFPSDKNFMSCLIQIEFLPTGIIVPGTMEFRVFKPNIYSSKSLIITDVIRFLIVFMFLIFMIIEFVKSYKDKSEGSNFYDAIVNTKTILTLFIFFMYAVSFFLKLTKCYNDETKFLNINADVYIDSLDISDSYNTIFYYESLIFAAVSIKILTFLRLNDHIKLFFTSIESAITVFIKYSFFFITILLGYSCIAYILWGPYITDFKSFGNSFLQILLFSMGNNYYNFRLF